MTVTTSNTKNVKIGVCLATFDNADLGFTKGGVEVSVTTETHKVNVDQFGKTSINEYIMGREVTVKVPLAETTLENLVRTMPGATLTTDATDPSIKRVDVTTGIGIDLLSLAKELRLHPKGKPADDQSEDFVIPLAGTAGAITFAYELENERVFNVTFTGYPDSASGKLFYVGDEAATA